jgi:5-amino-6-(5-phosphoribosylamino)uracil reductase
VLAISLDGRLAPAAGGAAQLGGTGDRRALEEALAWADGALIGAGTLRAHRTTCLIRDGERQAQRVQDGRPPQPVALVVSRQQSFPSEWPFFRQPLQRWLLTPPVVAPVPSGFDQRLTLGQSWQETLRSLAKAGLQRVLLLGGAQLCGSLLAEDVVDELQLTLTPKLLGGAHHWLPTGPKGLPDLLAEPGAWGLERCDRLEADEVLLHYCRQR